jgi:hypothetical protein
LPSSRVVIEKYPRGLGRAQSCHSAAADTLAPPPDAEAACPDGAEPAVAPLPSAGAPISCEIAQVAHVQDQRIGLFRHSHTTRLGATRHCSEMSHLEHLLHPLFRQLPLPALLEMRVHALEAIVGVGCFDLCEALNPSAPDGHVQTCRGRRRSLKRWRPGLHCHPRECSYNRSPPPSRRRPAPRRRVSQTYLFPQGSSVMIMFFCFQIFAFENDFLL